MASSDVSTGKKNAGYKAADLITDGMVIGLGTGSTVAFTMERLAERIRDGLRITGVPTSVQTAMRARKYGIPLTTLDDARIIDITIDGADQVDPNLFLVKGRGAAQVRERCVADASRRLVIVIDPSKLCDQLSAPVPVEVVPFALGHVTGRLNRLGGNVEVREGIKKDGPVFSDNGNIILDYHTGPLSDPQALEMEINNIPGVVSCGIMTEFAGIMTVIVGEESGCRIIGIS